MGRKRTGRSSSKSAILEERCIEWEDTPLPAAHFLRMRTLPHVVKLNSSDYGDNFGGGTHVDVSQPFLLYTARNCTKVLAEAVTWQEQRNHHVSTDSSIVIPTNYPGWFWPVTVEDNDAGPEEWSSVKDITFHNTNQVLSCEPVTCFRQSGQAQTGQRLYARVECEAGEVFTLGDRYVERTTRHSGAFCCVGPLARTRVKEVDYVMAQDASGIDLLLPMNTRGRFVRIGTIDDESNHISTNKAYSPSSENSASELKCSQIDPTGVYRISDILAAIDNNVTPSEGSLGTTSLVLRNAPVVRLVYGQAPATLGKFSGLLRLRETYTEQTVIACSLGTGNQNTLLEFPIDSEIEYIAAKNNVSLLLMPALERATEFCLEEVLTYIVSLKVIQNFYPLEKENIIANTTVVPIPTKRSQKTGKMSSVSKEQSAAERQSPAKLYVADDNTDNETVLSNETHYETIPFDRNHRAAVPSRVNHKESEYLVPVKANPNHIYSNMAKDNDVRKPSDSSASIQKPGPTCPANSIINDTNGVGIPDNASKNVTALNHLPPAGKERMDRFLQDSVEELNRIRMQEETASDTQHSNMSIGNKQPKPPMLLPKPPNQEIKAKLDAYLDEIFDCNDDVGTKAVLDPLNTRNAPDCPASTNRNEDNCKTNLHVLMRSASATLYPSTPPLSVGASAWSATPRAPSSVPRQHSVDPQEVISALAADSSSSTRSASDIYRQMSLPISPRSLADNPYARADSGIVVYRPGDYERGVYRALSEAGWRPPDDISALSVEEVAASLLYIGLTSTAAHAFSEQQIDGHQLRGMDASLLAEAFPQLNALDRKKVLDFINGWRPKKLASQ